MKQTHDPSSFLAAASIPTSAPVPPSKAFVWLEKLLILTICSYFAMPLLSLQY
jgi:hypothetical protein